LANQQQVILSNDVIRKIFVGVCTDSSPESHLNRILDLKLELAKVSSPSLALIEGVVKMLRQVMVFAPFVSLSFRLICALSKVTDKLDEKVVEHLVCPQLVEIFTGSPNAQERVRFPRLQAFIHLSIHLHSY
jgi:hypothetical protein